MNKTAHQPQAWTLSRAADSSRSAAQWAGSIASQHSKEARQLDTNLAEKPLKNLACATCRRENSSADSCCAIFLLKSSRACALHFVCSLSDGDDDGGGSITRSDFVALWTWWGLALSASFSLCWIQINVVTDSSVQFSAFPCRWSRWEVCGDFENVDIFRTRRQFVFGCVQRQQHASSQTKRPTPPRIGWCPAKQYSLPNSVRSARLRERYVCWRVTKCWKSVGLSTRIVCAVILWLPVLQARFFAAVGDNVYPVVASTDGSRYEVSLRRTWI